jgi:hypothetical protein
MTYILVGLFVIIIAAIVVVSIFLVKKGKTKIEDSKEKAEEIAKNQEEAKKKATQDQLPFEDIRKGVVILKNGIFLKILEVPSVNTQLMEPDEREIVRETYAQILNSLSFKIQFYKQSRLVDINEYISMLEEAERLEKNTFKAKGLNEYNYFIRELIRENSVQTKRDYVVISYREESKKKIKDDPDSLKKYKKNNDDTTLEENDEFYQKEKLYEKAHKILHQREQVLEKQIRRLGVTAKKLNNEELFELFYTTYNRDRSVYQSMKGKNPKDFAGLFVKREEL